MAGGDSGTDQVLMCDIGGLTRSWLMVAPSDVPGHTRICFRSAVVPAVNPVTGKSSLGFGFTALLGFTNSTRGRF